jgi:hypothetical protein
MELVLRFDRDGKYDIAMTLQLEANRVGRAQERISE